MMTCGQRQRKMKFNMCLDQYLVVLRWTNLYWLMSKPRNGAYRIVNRDVHFCTPPCSSLRCRNAAPLRRIKLDTATDPLVVTGAMAQNRPEQARHEVASFIKQHKL